MWQQHLLLYSLQYDLISMDIQALWWESKQKITGGIKMMPADCRSENHISTFSCLSALSEQSSRFTLSSPWTELHNCIIWRNRACIQVLTVTAGHHARYWQRLSVGLPLHPIATKMFQDRRTDPGGDDDLRVHPPLTRGAASCSWRWRGGVLTTSLAALLRSANLKMYPWIKECDHTPLTKQSEAQTMFNHLCTFTKGVLYEICLEKVQNLSLFLAHEQACCHSNTAVAGITLAGAAAAC